MADPIDRVVDGLALEQLDRDLFLGDPGEGQGRLFGGMVAAQSVMAAGRTLDGSESLMHSLHAFFLRPGRYDLPIRFVVDRIRDGRTFTTRRVVAHQDAEAIFSLAASFARPEEGGEHQDPMPDVEAPESLPTWEEARAHWGMKAFSASHVDAFEVRTPLDEDPKPGRYIWMRPRGAVPDDPLVHTAIAVYASDRTLASASVRPMGYTRADVSVASLDHAMWMHREPRFDDWTLYQSSSPVGHAARGLAYGEMYTQAGVRFASVAQEGLIRRARR